MKLIVPMAGIGKRMRPHTLTTPKPLLKLAGKSIVERIIYDFKESTGKKVEEIHFIIGDFGKEVEKDLREVAETMEAIPNLHFQREALGTAHAVYCAREALEGEVCVAFADTLYIGNIIVEEGDEAIIWTYRVENPKSYGVVVTDKEGFITDFKEKPKDFVSNEAIVGMYYFREAEKLRAGLKKLIDDKRMKGGEYQITDTLRDMMKEGTKFRSKNLVDWLDFGNKENFIKSTGIFLKYNEDKIGHTGNFDHLIPPVYIGKNVKIVDSTIGPNVIVEDNTELSQCELNNCVIGRGTRITKSVIKDSLVGNCCHIQNYRGILNLGDYNEISD